MDRKTVVQEEKGNKPQASFCGQALFHSIPAKRNDLSEAFKEQGCGQTPVCVIPIHHHVARRRSQDAPRGSGGRSSAYGPCLKSVRDSTHHGKWTPRGTTEGAVAKAVGLCWIPTSLSAPPCARAIPWLGVGSVRCPRSGWGCPGLAEALM